ncbi:TetR/AcrR family transcriptional regulator [Arenibaculum pallidiluteum]|uniref:TetR/AcrR family transcriptional regulator n=1 Tax=Arenibaculum pallidiluteum TaxID=2812559 RepID=UPI001A95E65E|nr:TetR/AcrR family transcriptional regulator [Arenibaculum pallidiluteum]
MLPSAQRHSRAHQKHETIIEAAKQVFLRSGYGANMDAVAAEAGVSKQTVYNHFGSKEALFAAIVEDLSASLHGALEDPARLIADPRGELLAFAIRYLETVLAPESLALHRMLIAEAPRFPVLAQQIYEHGPRRLLARLAACFREAERHGLLQVGDADRAAERFIGALIGHMQLRALLLVEQPSPNAAAHDAAVGAVDAFLQAHGAGRSERPPAIRVRTVRRA